MPMVQAGSEIYVTQNDMADVLLARAVFGAGDTPLAEKSPVTTGDFSLGGIALAPNLFSESPAVTVVNDFLPPLDEQAQTFEQMQGMEDMLGELMFQARLSKLTGCIMNPNFWRNDKMYAKLRSKKAKEVGLRTFVDGHRAARYLYDAAITGDMPTPEALRQQVDHICRNPSCFNPNHTRFMDNKTNNQLKDVAAKLEPKVTGGQLFYMRDLSEKLPWLSHTVIPEGEDLPEQVISTRLGPFALRYADPYESVVYGERLACAVYDNLREPAKSSYSRPSRAKKFKPIENHADLFPKTKFRKKQLVSNKELYDMAPKGGY